MAIITINQESPIEKELIKTRDDFTPIFPQLEEALKKEVKKRGLKFIQEIEWQARNQKPIKLKSHGHNIWTEGWLPPYDAPEGKVWRNIAPEGKFEWVLVDYNKHNKKPTNYTPKKKKRKR